MTSIFISYRRDDAAGQAGRLCDRLNARLGGERVFMDIEDIAPGQDFARAIDDRVAACTHLLVVIGPRWLEEMRRRAGADDFVRHEIASGLRRGLTVIPVLVANAPMPAATDLPPEIADLARRNAFELRDDRFDDDAARLIGALGMAGRTPIQARRVSRRVAVASVLVLAASVAAAWLLLSRPPAPDLTGEWVAELQKAGQRPYRVRLMLVQAGATIAGVVSYPTGDGPIRDGTIAEDGTITFETAHIPQFESAPAIIRFVARPEADGLHLITTDDNGVATGVARKAPESPPERPVP